MNFYQRKMERQRKKTNSLKNIFFIFIWIFLIFWSFFHNKYKNFKTSEIIFETKKIKIEKWDSFSNLSSKIPELDNFYYKIYLKNNKPNFELKEWNYEIQKWNNLEKIFENLQKPITWFQNITILEGWNIYDIDRSLSYKWLISEWEYINYVTNKEKILALGNFFEFLKNDELESLEWFLYPDTYQIDTENFKINNFVILQLENFEKKVYEKIFKSFDNKNIYEIVNLASIVEKEEGKIEENQPIVAGILKKRLKNNWMIWADATVCYPYKLPTSECTPQKVWQYVRDKNEYNTRTKTWLPKTPIANPSFTTINATLNSKETEYWFYLHNLSGKIFYAKTNEEHNFNKANYMNKK